jgi:hypothetical protein
VRIFRHSSSEWRTGWMLGGSLSSAPLRQAPKRNVASEPKRRLLLCMSKPRCQNTRRAGSVPRPPLSTDGYQLWAVSRRSRGGSCRRPKAERRPDAWIPARSSGFMDQRIAAEGHSDPRGAAIRVARGLVAATAAKLYGLTGCSYTATGYRLPERHREVFCASR